MTTQTSIAKREKGAGHHRSSPICRPAQHAATARQPAILTGDVEAVPGPTGDTVRALVDTDRASSPAASQRQPRRNNLESLTRSWAADYGPQGVRVNAIALGPTLTPAMDPMAHMLPTFVVAIPLRRAAQPIEIANAIAYLSSEESSFITGAVVPVDGGRQSVL